MINLITGVPGSGKTLHLISMLLNRSDLKNRPLYLDGIPDVDASKIPHQPIPEGESMETWHKWAPTGAILVIDEAQRVFRPRPSGSRVPDFVAELETHRHRGLDFFILTQHPRLIDANVRSLVGHHKHVSKTQLGFRRMAEWQRCANPESRADIKDAQVSIYKLDKKAYGVYKSAEEHTKIKTGRSMWVYVLPLAVLGLAVSLWYSISFIGGWTDKAQQNANSDPVATAETSIDVDNRQQQNANTGTYPSTVPQPEPQTNPNLKPEDFKPSIDGKPWTAPIYNGHNRSIQTMPYPVGCVKNGSRCTCYTEQATPLHDLDEGLCLDMVKNGIYNPYKSRTQAAQSVSTEGS
uniref:ZOT protein n=1 Tax=Dulem virus 54 TaxID=3145765 RepID=A0AAU8B2U6_9VIRU